MSPIITNPPKFTHDPANQEQAKTNLQHLYESASNLFHHAGHMHDLLIGKRAQLTAEDLNTKLDEKDPESPTVERTLRVIQKYAGFTFGEATKLKQDLCGTNLVNMPPEPQSRAQAFKSIEALGLQIGDLALLASCLAAFSNRQDWPKVKDEIRLRKIVQKVVESVKILERNADFILANPDPKAE